MSKTNQLHQDTVERVCDLYAEGMLTRTEAKRQLSVLGFDWLEADDWLDAAEAQYREANAQFGVGA